jgi:hypothetical protein
MQDEFPTHHTETWYVSHKVEMRSEDLCATQLPEVVVGSDGVSLKVLKPIFVDDEKYRSFQAVLSYPGVFPGKVRVELDLNPYSSHLGEIGLRTTRVPRLFVSAERYFDGAWNVLDALAAELAATGAEAAADDGQAA